MHWPLPQKNMEWITEFQLFACFWQNWLARLKMLEHQALSSLSVMNALSTRDFVVSVGFAFKRVAILVGTVSWLTPKEKGLILDKKSSSIDAFT